MGGIPSAGDMGRPSRPKGGDGKAAAAKKSPAELEMGRDVA